jgi:diguanylate cyclase (GGDEF)-like protein
MLMSVLDTVAEVYRRMGDLDAAAEYSARGHALAKEHRSGPDRGDALLTIARIALQRGRYDEALEAAHQSLALAVKHGRSIEEFTCHELLSRIDEARGDIASALAHYRRYHELERIRVNDETSTRLASLQVEHEVDAARKDAEIHRLRSLALQREVEERRILQTKLEAEASLDALTGLFNRRHVSVLAEDVERELALGRGASVIIFDLDRFKEINDTHGHFAGDRALVAIARLLRENARDSDTPVRYGGDEFLVLLGGTGTVQSRDIAERLRLAIATQPVVHRGASISLTASIGVASVSPGRYVGLPKLIERADLALYEAKRSGGNCVVVATS